MLPANVFFGRNTLENLLRFYLIMSVVSTRRVVKSSIKCQICTSSKLQMGLTTFKNEPDGRILKLDTLIAKNYLEEKELKYCISLFLLNPKFY